MGWNEATLKCACLAPDERTCMELRVHGYSPAHRFDDSLNDCCGDCGCECHFDQDDDWDDEPLPAAEVQR